MDAVKTHMPGQPDAAVTSVAALSWATREDQNPGMGLFPAVLTSKRYATGNNPAAKPVAEIGHAAANLGASTFLKQAAVPHSDAAAYIATQKIC